VNTRTTTSGLRSRAVALGLAAIFVTAAAGCAATPAEPPAESDALDFDDLVAAAQAEGSLTLYGDGLESTLQAWAAGFTDEYGIGVNILRMTGNELTQRFAQEASLGQAQADILSSTDTAAVAAAVEEGWIAEYTPAGADLFPAEFGMPGYYYPVQNGFFQTVAYNPDLLSEDEIELVREDPILAAGDPRFSGRVAVGAPQASQQATAFHYLYAEGPAADDYGWEALEAIADNDPLIFVQTVTMMQNLIAGEYAIAVGLAGGVASTQTMQGAPVEFAYPPVTTGGYFATGVTADAPHPNAARLFMEWASSAEGNSLYSQISQSAPTNSEVDDERGILEYDWYRDPDPANVWIDFITDEQFLSDAAPDGGFIAEWNRVFGYSG
jgi:iron(III) transport system substrate-binding protein